MGEDIKYIGKVLRAIANLVKIMDPDFEESDKEMAKHSKDNGTSLESFAVGSRTKRPHSENGWQLGGRKEESKFDPEMAQRDAWLHQTRTDD